MRSFDDSQQEIELLRGRVAELERQLAGSANSNPNPAGPDPVLDAFFAAAPGILNLLDRDLRFVNCDSVTPTFLGLDRQSIVGRSMRELRPEFVEQFLGPIHERVTSTGKPELDVEFSGAMRVRGGAPGHFRMSYFPVALPSGTGLGLMGVEITDIKRAEAELERRTLQLDSLLAHAPLGFAFFDREHRFRRMNEEVCRMSGLPAEAQIGRRVAEIRPGEAPALDAALDQVFTTGRPVERELTAEAPGLAGTTRHWLMTFYPVLNEAGETVEVGLFVLDITQRKRAEDELTASEARLAATLHSIVDEVWIVDAAGQVLLVNEAARQNLGVAPERWHDIYAALADLEVFRPDGTPRPAELAPLARALRGETLRREEEIIRNLSTGQLRWRELTAAPIRGAEGQITGAVLIARDISESRAIEVALRDSEGRYRQLFESMQEAFFVAEVITDEQGRPVDYRYLEANPALERITGLKHADLIGRRVSEAMPGVDRHWIETLGGVALTGKPATFVQYSTPLGRWYEASAYSPRPGAFATTFLDVTDRKRIEDELRESRARLAAALASMMDGVLITDAEGRFLDFNDAFARFHRFRNKEECGDRIHEYPLLFDAFLPDGSPAPFDTWPGPRALRGEAGANAEFGVRRKDTGEQWIGSFSFSPIRDQEGRVAGAVLVCRDITDHKRAEEKLRQTQKLESIGLLAGGIAHDFNNLLTGIVGNTSMVVDEVPEEHAERLRDVMANAERAAALTRQLLAYSGKGQFVVRDVDVSDAVNQMAALVEFSIPKSIEFSVTAQRRLPLVRMDPGQLEQILMNLVINAGEAIGEGNPGKIGLATSMIDFDRPFTGAAGHEIVPGRYVCVEVSDTGSGMTEETKPRIFDPFFTTKFTGRGLGLAAVAGILRTLKGGITVESAPGKGTTFRVLLPAVEQHRPASVEAAADQRGTILVVDDEGGIRNFIAAVLERRGFGVLAASDGKEALALMEREQRAIDAVVLDVIMPVMGAGDLLPRMKTLQPDLKVLLTSGYNEVEARRLCAAYPGAAFIQKPYTAQQIASAVESLLGLPDRDN